MALPILNIPPEMNRDDLLRLFHRTELQWARQVGEEQTLDAGTAIMHSAAPDVIDANAMHDAAIPPDGDAAAVIAEVNAVYASRGTRCRAWIINPSAPAERTAPLVDALGAAGAEARISDVMHTAQPIIPAAPDQPDLKIIPARASFRHTRQLVDEAVAHWRAPNLADVCMQRYDDPHYDALLALRDGQPVAHVGVLAVGDIGRIDDVYVARDARRQGLGTLMLARAMEICLRSGFKHVLLSVDVDNEPARRIYRACGMEVIGQFTSYRLA